MKTESIICHFCGNKVEKEKKQFWRLAKVGFSSRRKQLKNNLQSEFDQKEIKNVLVQLGLKETVRAQELSVDDWSELSKLF